MSKNKDDINSNFELLIGLKLFDADQITDEEKKVYKNYFKKFKGSSNDLIIKIDMRCNFSDLLKSLHLLIC